MRILIIALGSRGDVQPYIALGKGLKQAGHTVRFVTYQNFELLVNLHGLEFYPLEGNVQEIVQTQEIAKLLEKGNFLAITYMTAQKAKESAINSAAVALEACQGMDLILAGMGGVYLSLSLAQKLDLPLIQAYVVPFTPTKAFPSVLLPQAFGRLGATFRYWSHHLTRQAIWQGFRSADRLVREQLLDLPPTPFFGPERAPQLNNYPILYGFSPSVIPKPTDWNENIHVSGYWFLDSSSDWIPPDELIDFLNLDPTPIYIGFGSMSNHKPEEITELILQALAQTQQRAVIQSGWGGLSPNNLPDTVFLVDSIPHSWLFSHVAAVVHHGGAGTTAAALAAGIPSIVIPFFGDQFFWGEYVAQLGVGTQPILRKQLTVAKLAKAINLALTDSLMRQNAANLGLKIEAEDGITNAIAVIENAEYTR